MPEGTEASQWASAPPVTKESTGKESASNTSRGGGRGNSNRNRKPPRRRSSANTNANSQGTPATESPAPTQQGADTSQNRPKLIDRLSAPPEASPPVPASTGTGPKADTPGSKSSPRRRGRGRSSTGRKPPPSKVNTGAAQKVLEKEVVQKVVEEDENEEPEPEPAVDTQKPKDPPPHVDDADANSDLPTVNGLADRLKALNPSAPTTPRPFTPSAIDWAGETEDGSLPDLDDWGVTAKSTSPTHKDEEENQPSQGESTAPPVTEPKSNGRQRRKDSKTSKNLTVPGRNGVNASGNSSRPVTPSSAGFGSPSLRGRVMPARTSSRASNFNDAPPQITVTSNPNSQDQDQDQDQDQPSTTTGLGLDLSVAEPVFASINDPPLERPPEDVHIRPVRAPNTHHSQRGGRGRGGRPRMSDSNGQPGAGSGFGAHMYMGSPSPHMPPSPHLPPSPHMPPSPHLPPSPYMPGGHLPPNGFQPYNPGGFMGYPQPPNPGFASPGFVHQPYSHHPPRHNTHHPQRTNSDSHSQGNSSRHQRTRSRPIITGNALSRLNRTVQDATSPPKPKPDVSASS